jgi:chromosome partitioning protein
LIRRFGKVRVFFAGARAGTGGKASGGSCGVIVTVTSNKGGVSKTTTSMHLAGYLAERGGGGRTVVVDLDPNASALDWAARAEKGGKPLPFVVVGPGEDYGKAEHVIFDSPGRLYGEELEAMAEVSDLVVVPTLPTRLSVDVLAGLVADLAEVGRADAYKVLLTMVPRWNLRGRQAREELRDVGVPLFRQSIRLRPAFDTAADRGVLVRDVRVRGAQDGWDDYMAFGREVVEG